ncbi:MAG TPA: 6-carboxytetrahydropterin synthase [Prochlorococcaceae cyanobacterium AMR_MDS_5431]|nr:6-carboxytetrahydropterin synthase [Prochlorococcaceae cyanobacterium AMR_MDS_5431]
MINTLTSSKVFSGYPCCHRQWDHHSHCQFIHGYSRSFILWFRASVLDKNGFVVDFSSLKNLEARLTRQFDHTCLINSDDPLINQWEDLHNQGALDLRIMSNVSMEASAELVWSWANELLLLQTTGRSCCWKVEARENEKNAAYFEGIPSWFKN